MKKLALHASIVLALLGFVPAVHAQYYDVIGGSLTVTFSSALQSQFAAQNISAAAYTPAPYDVQLPLMGLPVGGFNMTTQQGAFSVQGVLTIQNGSTMVQFQNIAYEQMGGSHPVITGSLYLNNKYVTHMVIFNAPNTNPLNLPVTTYEYLTPGFPVTFSKGVITLMSQVFGMTIAPQTEVAMMGGELTFGAITIQ